MGEHYNTASVAVGRAVAAGDLIKPRSCESCGKRRRLLAHHFLGYERQHWLDVKWLCSPCHGKAHYPDSIPKKPKNKLVDVHFILHSDDEHQRALFQYMQRTRRHRSFTQHLHEMVHFAAAQMSANDHKETAQNG